MYVFIKKFLNNQQIYGIFNKWYHKEDIFDDASYYATLPSRQQSFYELNSVEYRKVFDSMQKTLII